MWQNNFQHFLFRSSPYSYYFEVATSIKLTCSEQMSLNGIMACQIQLMITLDLMKVISIAKQRMKWSDDHGWGGKYVEANTFKNNYGLYFWGLHPVTSTTNKYSLGMPSVATVFFPNVFITISYPLHVSAPMGHLQVVYLQVYIPPVVGMK
jgi:hypothetical protein